MKTYTKLLSAAYQIELLTFDKKKCSDLLVELSRREKEASIVPDPETDIYMKV